MLTVTHAGLTDLGCVRRENEDAWYADPDIGLYLVADGMGGHLGGAVASKIVVEALPYFVRSELPDHLDMSSRKTAGILYKLLANFSNSLRDGSEERPDLTGMGSTVVFVLLRASTAFVAHMGDSRAYLFRNSRLRKLTRDHTIIQLLLESGDITEKEADSHPARGQLTRYVGMEGEPLPDIHTFSVRRDDRILLCSDGLTEMLADEGIKAILADEAKPGAACTRLIAAANEAGGKDNVTIIVIAIAEEKAALKEEPGIEVARFSESDGHRRKKR
ncbi:MAG: Stp1/IreP family PP2C-type Ser/Thr phosphatase [Candidatus Abyssobacteria bacterium SURF_5]|uniref:Stp1/IreP family PP2C-type Ser/Thr phosphatase n=1 Tax=Abyssobacteria bacterium (strain SURF_5) TaxID=2093360 RepID=A0A3A4P4D7_ABYX5|nr:MAG: Stp1/IreP family PP2C-type Ser/Thr phosphatase [Candidatus Abyssubacteria bacterium SURF_5]